MTIVPNPDPSSPADADVAAGLRFDNPQSQFAPDGMISVVTGNQPVTDVTTQSITLQNYRMGKFVQIASGTAFEDLQEVDEPSGDTVWVLDTAIDSQDFNFYMSKAEILGSVTLTVVQNEQQIQQVAQQYNISESQTYITIDGVNYFTRMNVPLHFGTGTNSDVWVNLGVFVLGDGLVATAIAGVITSLGADAFSSALKNIGSAAFKVFFGVIRGAVTAAFRFIMTFVSRLLANDAADVALTAARSAAGDAWGAAVGDITLATLGYAVIGVVVILAVLAFTEYVLHYSYQNVYFYNLTSYDVALDFPYESEGDYYNLPTNTVLAAADRTGPGGIDLGDWYNGVAFRYQSGSEFEGLGYTMRFKMLDPQTQNLVKTFSCLFDVPFAGNNSLFASTSEPASYSDYYSANEGQQNVTQFSVDDGAQQIIVTYDYLSGENPDPETGENQYLYNSLIVIRDVVAGQT